MATVVVKGVTRDYYEDPFHHSLLTGGMSRTARVSSIPSIEL